VSNETRTSETADVVRQEPGDRVQIYERPQFGDPQRRGERENNPEIAFLIEL
jgi:hypothetical protein